MVVLCAALIDSEKAKFVVLDDTNNSNKSSIYRCNANVATGQTLFSSNSAKFDIISRISDLVNFGPSGVSIYKGKNGNSQELRKINCPDGDLNIAVNGSETIVITIDQSAIDHDNLQNVGTNDHASIDTHIADDSKHRVINDSTSGVDTLYSSSKIEALVNQANTGFFNHKGNWNASTNTPALSDGSGADGDYYKVTVSGSTSIDGETD